MYLNVAEKLTYCKCLQGCRFKSDHIRFWRIVYPEERPALTREGKVQILLRQFTGTSYNGQYLRL